MARAGFLFRGIDPDADRVLAFRDSNSFKDGFVDATRVRRSLRL